MTRLSVALGIAAIEDEDYFRKTTGQIVETREWTKERLTELGFSFGDSKTNFIFAKHATVDAEEIFAKLREKGVDTAFVTLHVGLGTFRPVKEDNILDHKMHVEHYSIPQETADKIKAGTREEMEKLIDELKYIL